MSRPRSARSAGHAAGVLVAVLLLGSGCSAGHDLVDVGAAPRSAPDAVDRAPALPTKATIRDVTGGKLDARARARLKRQISETVDTWFDAAYLGGDYPRSDFGDSFAVFTAGARDRAAADKALMTNAAVGPRVESVRATKRRLKIDVLTRKGRAVAVTAHVALGMRFTGGIERTERVTGALYLTNHAGTWRVFGYDMSRGQV